MGKPTWEVVPYGEGTYREVPRVPVFRSTTGAKIWVLGSSVTRERQVYRVLRDATWSVCSLSAALVQVLWS